MEASIHWLKLEPWITVTCLVHFAVCEIDIKFLRSQPCDIYENDTLGTVEFNCNDRGLRTMPTVFSNVTSLDLSENKIKNLTKDAMKGLHKLSDLNLSWMNQKYNVNISTGVFSDLTSLQKLQFSGAGLKQIPQQLPNSLRELVLIQNKIIWLNSSSFSNVKNLTYLCLSKNCYYWNACSKVYQIETDTFSNLAQLQYLILTHNNLTHVPKGLPVSLITLDLASNRIWYIGKDDFKGLKNLKNLKIQGNCPRCQNAPFPCIPCPNGSIEIHEQAFDHLRNLEFLHLAGNSITFIKKAWFENISNLQKLYLSYNFLAKAIEHGEFLSKLPLLKKLDLSFNYGLKAYPDTIKLASSFANLTSLQTLHIRGLVFKTVDNFTLKPLYGLQNLSILDVGTNFIVNAKSDAFIPFRKLKLLYLSENRLYPISSSEVRKTGNNVHGLFNLPLLTVSSTPKGQDYDLPKSLVKHVCYAAGRVLDLSGNNLFFINPKQFEGYENISCLNLSSNGFAAALNGTEFALLPHLKYLDLSFNKIDLAYDDAFKELKRLEVLDMSFNPHYFTVQGVTHNLNFLKNLPFLRVLNMSSNSIYTLTTKQMSSDSLNELQFQHNQLGKMWREKDQTYDKIFCHLSNLTYLDVSYNNINKIPNRIYNYLPVNIKKCRLSHNALTSFNWTSLKIFTQLEELILNNNHLMFISKNLSSSVPSLHHLDLSFNRISQLYDGFLLGAVNLKLLNLSHNRLAIINQSTFPPKEENHLSMLWLHGNPFYCTCDIIDFILWIYKSNVMIPNLATSVKCSLPEPIKGKGVIFFDINECIDDHIAFLAYFCFTLFILGGTFVATVMHWFYWDVSYLFYYLKARLKGYQELSCGNNIYDAFVTYDTKDQLVSEWVLNNLRLQLEKHGNNFLPICLQERDWLPGCPIVDSLNQSICLSRKTIFVLTHSYVNSGSFKMAMYLAHQRLLEESKDVIVLLLLEPVLQNSHFLKLRRRLCGNSVLDWPRTPAAEPWFWQSLRTAIRVENKVMYNKIYSKYFTFKNKLEQ